MITILKHFVGLVGATFVVAGAYADGLFFDDETIQNGVNVVQMSNDFADVYETLDKVDWRGRNVDVSLASLENIHKNAHVELTGERVILVWNDKVVANYPRPADNNWAALGQATTALALKMRERIPSMANDAEIYRVVVDSLIRGINEYGRYVFPQELDENEDNRILTSVGIEGARDERGNFRVFGVYKGSPADVAGIASGDLIGEINGTLVAELSDSAIASMLSGFDSGTLKMTLISPTGTRRVVVRRATVVIADADIVFLNDDKGGVLNIIVNKVSDNSVKIIEETLEKYKDLTGVLLDLRSAMGDNEIAATKLAGMFVGQKPVMRIVESQQDEIEIVPSGTALTDAPVVVAVSNMTRGPAEAIAAAIYENKRGVLIGTPTSGVARIASKIKLKNGGMLELYNKSMKTGQGRVLDERGVFPIVCIANLNSNQQQEAFFLNVLNGEFNAQDFNVPGDINLDKARQACPVIANGADEDLLTLSVGVKILTDANIYDKLLNTK